MRIIESPLTMTAEEMQDRLEAWRLLGDPEQVAVIDIETTGFSRLYDSIYLIGIVFFRQSAVGFHVRQYLAGSLADEAQVLEQALDQLQQFTTIVTYNGDMFDLPFIEERGKRLHIWRASDRALWQHMHSADLLRLFRSHQSFFGWPNLKLKTLQAALGIQRQDPFDGGQLIEVFYEYARTDDERLEKVLLLHNYEDILYLMPLLNIQRFIHTLRCGRIEAVRYEDGELLTVWDRPFALSHSAEMALTRKKQKEEGTARACYTFEAGSRCSRIRLPQSGKETTLWYYLPNPQDYYFLPAKNEIVHRSLAYDVPPGERRKARAAECAVPGQGCFRQILPAKAGTLRCYRSGYRDPDVFAQEQELTEWLARQETEDAAEWVRQFYDLI